MSKLEINKTIHHNYAYNYAQESCEIYYNSPNYYKIEIEKLNQSTDILLRYIYQKSIKENYYFFDCPAKVYINHYENRKYDFLKIHIDSDESDFINSEIKNLENPKQHQILTIKYKCINKYLAKKNKELINFNHLRASTNSNSNIISFSHKTAIINYTQLIKTNDIWKYSHRNKVKFLKAKLKKIHSVIENEIPDEYEVENNKQLTVNQGIILLSNWGVFSDITMENSSKKKQSELISLLFGKNVKNIKISLEKLEKHPSELGSRYRNDLIKIQHLLKELNE